MDAKYITGLLRNQSVKYLLVQCSDKVIRNSSQFFTPFHDLIGKLVRNRSYEVICNRKML